MAAKKNSDLLDETIIKSKKKSTASSSGTKSTAKKTKKSSVKTEYDRSVPGHVIVSCVSFVLFVLFIVISINPDGKLLQFLQSLVMGLIGQAGFYFSIPALAYLFCLQTFKRNQKTNMRSICLMLFVFCCGSIFHLFVQRQGMATGFAVFADLYIGGLEGTSGGVLCGGFAMLLRWACGQLVAAILIVILTILSLLGTLEITIPSIIKAIANRPRDDWEDEDEQEYVEPAAVVVNHIANKRIEKNRQRRQVQIPPEREISSIAERRASVPSKKQSLPGQIDIPAVSAHPEDTTAVAKRASSFMNTIELDIGAPVVPGPSKTVAPAVPVAVHAEENEFEEQALIKMPELDTSVPLNARKKETVPPAEKTAVSKTHPVEKNSKVTTKDTEESAIQVAQEIAKNQNAEQSAYCFPPIELLKKPANVSADGTDEMRDNSRRLNETLASFHIDAHIINVTRGPSVTRYEVELDKGVRLNKLTGCADDIALSLGASGVRIAAVPGKISVVGIEVPNRAVTTVSLREVIDSQEFSKAKSKSSFSVGKDISGACIVGNIAKMPHMLIAGTTGSGKSVCMNSIIISLLYKASPDDVKLIMVDPKMVELGIYNGIPHLLIPVVTDPKKAAGSLQWAVTEMLRRYKLMSDAGVRDLESYNSIMQAENGHKLPQVVIIIDELADLMLVAAKEVEDSICRVAQMGRASGMHLIIATQRPSADVITGLMKANIPSRIAFSVASAMESRIILDTQGAEKLVGKGDMLYAPIGCGKPLRVQGCFVTDSEVEAVAGYVKDNYVADYNQQVLDEIEKKAQQTGKTKNSTDIAPNEEELDGDEMLPAAVDVILETGQASVSMLQRRLKLGYARAARIVDEMEEKGIVGPFQGSKPRAILITKDQWEAMQAGGQAEMNDSIDEDVPF